MQISKFQRQSYHCIQAHLNSLIDRSKVLLCYTYSAICHRPLFKLKAVTTLSPNSNTNPKRLKVSVFNPFAQIFQFETKNGLMVFNECVHGYFTK